MINNYNKFVLNESMNILEAFLSADSDILSKLDKISRQSDASAYLANVIISKISDKEWISSNDLKYDFFKSTEENDKLSFIQSNRIKDGINPYNISGRTDIKVGRAIRYIANDLYNLKITDKQVEDFINVYKSIPNEGEPNFQFYVGDDIKKGYTTNNYYSRYGSLGGSCMNDKLLYLNIYAVNDKKIRLLVLLDDNGSICGRALIWKLDKSPCDAEYFMDRVYVNRDYEINKFIKYAEDNGFLYKSKMICGDLEAAQFKYNGEKIYGEIRVNIKKKKTKYPYLDTLFSLNREKNELSNIPSWKSYKLFDTQGNCDRCDDCNGKSKNDDICYGCSEGAILLKEKKIDVNLERGRKNKKKT